MSNLTRAVPLLEIQHPRVPSSTSSATICERCHGLLPMTMVTPAYMPRFHTSQEWEMVQCNEVIASLSLQISLCPSLAKPLGIFDFQPQTIMVDTSCLHSTLGMTLQLLSYLEYDDPLLRPHRRCQDQI
jgi:hypothetical protein